MLALAGLATYLFHQHNLKTKPEIDTHAVHYREKIGINGMRSFTKTAPERELPRVPQLVRSEQPPEVLRQMPDPRYREPTHLTRARLDRLYEAMPDGPIGFARGKIDKDRHLISNRVPHHHPGLTKVGIDDPRAAERPAPTLF